MDSTKMLKVVILDCRNWSDFFFLLYISLSFFKQCIHNTFVIRK